MMNAWLPAPDWPNDHQIFTVQLNPFGFMMNHKIFAFAQLIRHGLQTDLDPQHLPAIRHKEPQFCVVLGRTTWPE